MSIPARSSPAKIAAIGLCKNAGGDGFDLCDMDIPFCDTTVPFRVNYRQQWPDPELPSVFQ